MTSNFLVHKSRASTLILRAHLNAGSITRFWGKRELVSEGVLEGRDNV